MSKQSQCAMKGLECKGYFKMLSNCAGSLKADFENNKRQCGKPFSNFLRSRLRSHFWFAMEGANHNLILLYGYLRERAR